MNSVRTNKQGFTMVELLVVLVIIGILAAVATPIFLGNTQKAKASEAVAAMSLIRQAQRDYFINNNTYLTSISTINDPLPTGVAVNTGVAQYFSNEAYKVVPANSPEVKAPFSAPLAQDYVIRVSGSASKQCLGNSDTICAIKQNDIKDFELEMDNSGRVFVSYGKDTNGNAKWQKY